MIGATRRPEPPISPAHPGECRDPDHKARGLWSTLGRRRQISADQRRYRFDDCDVFCSSNRFGLSFTLALTAADAVYTVGQFAEALLLNPPQSGGVADGVMASEFFMVVAIFLIQWPVIALLSLPPALGAPAYQNWEGIRSTPVFIACGAVMGSTVPQFQDDRRYLVINIIRLKLTSVDQKQEKPKVPLLMIPTRRYQIEGLEMTREGMMHGAELFMIQKKET
jgi:hypothetical protein